MRTYRTVNIYLQGREVEHAVNIFRAAADVLARKSEPTGMRCAYLQASANEIEKSSQLTVNFEERALHSQTNYRRVKEMTDLNKKWIDKNFDHLQETDAEALYDQMLETDSPIEEDSIKDYLQMYRSEEFERLESHRKQEERELHQLEAERQGDYD